MPLSLFRNLLKSEDLSLTAQALTAMGAGIKELNQGLVAVQGFNGRPIPHEAPITAHKKVENEDK